MIVHYISLSNIACLKFSAINSFIEIITHLNYYGGKNTEKNH